MDSTVTSYGLACIYENRICMVMRRTSFKFNELMRTGKINQDMFNHMTIHEKLTLSTLNFDACDRLLGYVYLDNSNLDTLKRKDKFDKMVSDGGKKLMNMIQKSNNNPSQIWEIPKGRKRNKPGEQNMNVLLENFVKRHYYLEIFLKLLIIRNLIIHLFLMVLHINMYII